jgi:hypothetical protein
MGLPDPQWPEGEVMAWKVEQCNSECIVRNSIVASYLSCIWGQLYQPKLVDRVSILASSHLFPSLDLELGWKKSLKILTS